MLKHILVAFDGSASAQEAAKFALTLAEVTHAKATLLTVLPPPDVLPVGPLSGYAVLTPPPTPEALRAAQLHLEQVAKTKPEVPVTCRVEIGEVEETILSAAADGNVDLIVMGARGLGPARRFLMGSVSDRVTRHAHCPVTVWR